ncbi:hypothetical protein ACWDXT_35410, partial [Streptomyces sp. NPDC003236]
PAVQDGVGGEFRGDQQDVVLRAALYLGMVLMSVAFAYAAWIVGVALVKGVDTPGYVTLIVVVTALAGVQMVIVGVVGEYVGRIYYEVKRRPHFLVKASNTGVPSQQRSRQFVRR